MKGAKSSIIHTDSGSLKNTPCKSKQEPVAVSSLPQILVAMNLAFAISGNSHTISKQQSDKQQQRSAWWAIDECDDDEDDDIATDASVKHCHTNHDSSWVGLEDLTVPSTVVTTTTSHASSPRSFGALTLDSFDSQSEMNDTKHNNNKKPKKGPKIVKDKIHDLRTDLQELTPSGVAGNFLFWWVHPVKWVADPAFGVAESIVPAVTSKVPFSDKLVGLGLDATTSVAHFAYGVTEHMGVMTSSRPDFEELRARIMTQLLSLADSSMAVKDKFIKALYAEAGKQEFLLDMDKDLFFSLTLQQNIDIETWTKGFGGLYEHMTKANLKDEIEKFGGMLRYFENKALLGVLQQAHLNMQGKCRYEKCY